MIPGEPLIDHQPPVTPPGVRHRNPVHDFVHRVLIVIGVAVGVLGVVALFWAVSPDTTCIAPPTGPGIAYDGATNMWTKDGATVGYAEEEDDECLTATPPAG